MKVKTTTIRGKDEEDASLFISGSTGIDDGQLGSDGESADDDEKAHKNLISDISHIIKSRKMVAAPRSVRMSNKEGGTTVDTTDILRKLGIKNLENVEALSTPIEKVVAKRAKRAVGYDNVACEADKWSNLVHRRRVQSQLSFPLQQPDLRVHTSLKTKEIQMKTSLEQEVYSLLTGAKLMKDVKETNAEAAKKRAMTLAEIKESNRLLWKQKEERRRMERKLWMQNKNKSRKYHRLLRKDRLKKQKAELEELQKNDPEAAIEKLEELEKARAQERMTLRHKKSKWAHLQGMRATRDESAMAALQENQNMYQELTAKRKNEESSSEEEEEEEENIEEKLEALRKEKQSAIEAGLFDPSNPWTRNLFQHIPERAAVTPQSAIDDSFVNFKKFWDEVNRRKIMEKEAMEAIAKKESEREKEEEGSVGSDVDEEEEEGNSKDTDGEEESEMEKTESENKDEKLQVKEKKEDEAMLSVIDPLKKTKKSKKKTVIESTAEAKAQTSPGKNLTGKKRVKNPTGKAKVLKEDKPCDPHEDVIKKTKKKMKGKKVEGENATKTAKKISQKKVDSEDIKKTKKKIKGKKVDDENALKTAKKIKRKKGDNKNVTKTNGKKVDGKDVMKTAKEIKGKKVDGENATKGKKKVKSKTTNQTLKKKEEGKLENQKMTKGTRKVISSKIKKQKASNLKVKEKAKKKKVKKVKKEDVQNLCDDIEIAKAKIKKVSVSGDKPTKNEGDEGKKKVTTKKPTKKDAKSETLKETSTKTQEDSKVDFEEQLISIDNLFSKAEIALQKKLNKKLKKMGIDTKDKTEWTKVKSRKKKRSEDKSILPKIEEYNFEAKDNQPHNIERMNRAKTMEDMDALQEQRDQGDELQTAVETLKKGAGETSADDKDKKTPVGGKKAQIDPSKFLQVDSKVLQAAMPDTITKGMEGLDDDEEEDDAEDVIRQAFADDYLVDEFNAEKDAAIEKDKPKDLCLAIPGWGDWTGPNIKMTKRKIRRYTIRAPPPPPRKDATLGNVIYNEKSDVHNNLRKLMVSDLPYPFSRVQDFEASIRAPIGRMFVPEKEHAKLTLPPVVTKAGTIIEPMTEEELLKTGERNMRANKRKDESQQESGKSAHKKKKTSR